MFRNYGKKLLTGSLKLHWSCFDMTMNIMPAFVLSTIQLMAMLGLLIANLIVNQAWSLSILKDIGVSLAYGYGIFFILGFFALVTEWKKIHCNKFKAILLFFTFPIFMLTYVPISAVALFSHVDWQPIAHKHAITVKDVEEQEKANLISTADKGEE